MATHTFPISGAKVVITTWPATPHFAGGYSARLQEPGHGCPSAAGVGPTPAAALMDMAKNPFAEPYHAAITTLAASF